MRQLSKNFIYISIIGITLLSSCKSSRYGIVKRTFHDVTAHYNGYFNAKQRVDNTELQADKAFQDKYDELLPIFKLVRDEDAASNTKKTGNQALDDAIKKASLVIQRHERSKWIDDCYFEIGRSYFYKKDYFTAAETFQFIAGRYKGSGPADVAYIWLIKSYIMLKKYNQAESVINVALASETFPKKNISELFAVIAWYHVDKKNYTKAIEYLEKSVQVQKKKSIRARYTYIIAQLYEKIEEDDKAGIRYQQVLKLNPPYELAFNSKINSARLVQTSSAGNRKSLEKELIKMLSDAKNIEYRDQLYYSLGLIYEKASDERKAIQSFQLSASSSVQNLSQKGKAFLKLANIFYVDENYEPAQIYYDSASTFLAKTHPDFELANKRKISLSKLVDNLKIINREDSLQRLAKMPEKDLIAFVEGIVKKEKEEKLRQEEEIRRNAEQALNNLARVNESSAGGKPTAGASGSTWYFYNQNAIASGNADFTKKFGRRTLEDNWRRANKESFASMSALANGETGNEIANNSASGKNDDESIKRRYLANIPTTEAARVSSTDKMVKAYFNIGQFYREEIINTNESIKAYQTCITRFPGNKYAPEIYFNLYRLNNQINNKQQAEYFKNKLLNEYPNSIMAKVVLDPSYVSESKAVDKAAQEFYDNLYDAYLNSNYASVLSAKPRIDSQYTYTSIAPKYYLLSAYSQKKLKGVNELEVSLNELIQKFPSSDAANTAREILRKLSEQKNPELTKAKAEDPITFEIDPRAKYYVMISLDMAPTRETKLNLFRFNNMEFSLNKIQIQTDLIGENDQVIYMAPFQDTNAAREYITALTNKLTEVIKLKAGTYVVSYISEKNYKTLKETKAIQQYIQFYNANYQSNE
ncbi:MAG: tetratricopeptide repeat protein [Sphingobacteriales bacterium]|nr:tetratricopeptide repeat protein [Sphingobacteriales bacterium]